MAWMSIADQRGRGWQVDIDRVRQIFYSEAFSREKESRADREVKDHGLYPTTVNIVFDFRGVQSTVRQIASRNFQTFVRELQQDGRVALELVLRARREGMHAEELVRQRQQQASQTTLENISNAVWAGNLGRNVAEFLGKLSTDILIVGSALITGGATALTGSATVLTSRAAFGASSSVLGFGSVLQSIGTYQDTGSVGAAVLHGTTRFVTGLIPISRAAMVGRTALLTSSETKAIFFVGIKLDFLGKTVVSLSQGRDVKSAIIASMADASMTAVVPVVGNRFFDSLALPMRAVVSGSLSRSYSVTSSALANTMTVPSTNMARLDRGTFSVSSATVAGSGRSRSTDSHYYVDLFAMRSYERQILPQPTMQDVIDAARSH